MDGEITTTFEYDGIDRLVRVTDTEGNVTTAVYDMGDRRTEVNPPASGITTFTYDALGNVLTKQTANLAKEGKSITYDYDYHRLTGINYPDLPENNVKYYYGGRAPLTLPSPRAKPSTPESHKFPRQLFGKPNNISNLRMLTSFGASHRPQQAPRNPQHCNHEKAAKHIIHLAGGDRNHGARPHLTRAWQRGGGHRLRV